MALPGATGIIAGPRLPPQLERAFALTREVSMPHVVRAGLALGVLVEIWTAIVIAARWHVDPSKMWLFFLVIPLQLVVVVGALRREAPVAGYGKQVLNGLVVSAVAAVIVFAGSYLLTTVVFPNYFPELRAAGEALHAQSGMTPEQIEAQMRGSASMYDPVANAMSGAIATVVTGLVISAIAGAFLRKKA
jgi:hypothetical protein